MRLLVALIAFASTLGFLFFFEKNDIEPANLDAQILTQKSDAPPTTEFLITQQAHKGTTTVLSATPKPSSLTLISTVSILPSSIDTPTPPSSGQILTPTYTPTPTPIPVSTTLAPTPTPTPSQTLNQIFLVSITSPIKRGLNAKLVIKTAIGAGCSVKVTLPSTTVSGAQGLQGERTADSNGGILWEWRISSNTKPGDAQIEISCINEGQSYTGNLQMTITE